MINKIYGFFIPSELKIHPDEYRQAKISVLFYLFNALGLVLNSYSGFQVNFPPFTYSNLAYASISIGLAFAIRAGVSLRLCAAILAAIGFFYVAFVICNTGGTQSPTVFGVLFAPLYYLFLSNSLRNSIICMIISLSCVVGFHLYEVYVGEIPVNIDTTNLQEFEFLVIMAQCVTVFVLVSIFHSQKDKAVIELTDINQNLKKTQAQLIQAEKLASLGELTAGIAHEIQNPLNFVNNFSEVTGELVEEVLEERNKALRQDSGSDENLVDEILVDIKENLKKIHHHGNRASSIVKGMLEHSRTSSGEKELTDINALADEYLRLAYHGLRAKEKDFNSEMVTNFAPTLPKIKVISQDIGRVLLNLINNAFQAVQEEGERRKEQGDHDYKPQVSVTTSLINNNPLPNTKFTNNQSTNNHLLIIITDNGPGIPDAIKDKIFQPFFTTKDAGKGTGLGLSLAYDIMKAHGGEICISSKVSDSLQGGTSFKLVFPLGQKA